MQLKNKTLKVRKSNSSIWSIKKFIFRSLWVFRHAKFKSGLGFGLSLFVLCRPADCLSLLPISITNPISFLEQTITLHQIPPHYIQLMKAIPMRSVFLFYCQNTMRYCIPQLNFWLISHLGLTWLKRLNDLTRGDLDGSVTWLSNSSTLPWRNFTSLFSWLD